MDKGLMAKDEWSNLGLNFDKLAEDTTSGGTDGQAGGGGNGS